MLKILQVIDRLDTGGAEKVFLHLTNLLLNDGFEVSTLCISEKGTLYNKIDERANRIYLNRKKKYSLQKMLQCAAICKKYDIVHIHFRHTYVYVKIAQLISISKFKIIFHDHSSSKEVPFLLKYFFKPQYYIGVSNEAIQWAKINLKISEQNTFLLPNTISKIPVTISTKDKDSWVMVANIRRVKNIELFLHLASYFKKNITVIGKIYEENYFQELKQLAKLLNVNTTFLTDCNEVQPEIVKYSLGIHTSFSETGPLVLLEFLAQGIPFVAHAVGEVSEKLQNSIPQSFVKSLNEAEWIDAIKIIEKNPPTPYTLKNLFNTFFGTENNINQCKKIYEKVANY